MTRVVDKVQRLIALAASSNVEEARNAAYLACQLIREHRLDVVAKRDPEVMQIAAAARAAEPTIKFRASPTVGLATRVDRATKCTRCPHSIEVGAPAVFEPGRGVAHQACWRAQ